MQTKEHIKLFLKYENNLVGEIQCDGSIIRTNYTSPLINSIFSNDNISKNTFYDFLINRVISSDRRDINTLLARLGLSEYDVFEIAKRTRAFSLSDKFWISYSVSEDYNTTYISVFEVLYNNQIGLNGDSISSPCGINVKNYYFRDNDFGIVKKKLNRNSTDIYNEVVTYRLSKLLGIECCEAFIVNEDSVFSKYEFDPNKESLIHARHLLNSEILSLDTYEDILDNYFKDIKLSIIKMILFDFVTNQDDRHTSNWSIVIKEDGTRYMYKLYDNGRCLFYDYVDMPQDVNIDLLSNSFGLVGTYKDVVIDISKTYNIKELINIDSITKDVLYSCFDGLDIPNPKVDFCVKWISESVKFLKSLCYKIRKIKPDEYYLLKEFTYEAIFQRDENNPINRDVLELPEIKVFYDDFGKPDDLCLVAEYQHKIIGAVWTRILNGEVKGFGNIDDKTPEFAISIYKQYRGNGIGTKLMTEMLKLLQDKGYKSTSLAVQKDNYAVKMYQNVGFKIIKETEEEFIMVCKLI